MNAQPNNLRHWRLEVRDNGVVWAWLDRVNVQGAENTPENHTPEHTNVLTREVMAELAQCVSHWQKQCEHTPNVLRGIVFASAKDSGFIAGADIEEFTQIRDASTAVQVATQLVERGWNLYNQLAALPVPTLALIRGFCMGGGLELALACKYRIVVDEPSTRLALPEVMLGIVPGWGGMLRLPQLVGAPAALDMMLTGRAVDARKAKRMGLADVCVPPRLMQRTADEWIVSGKRPRSAADLPWMQRLMLGPLKSMVVRKARAQVMQRARPEHYPAPYAILDMWANYGGNALAVPSSQPTSMAALATSPTTPNLLRVYQLQERLKRFGRESDFKVKHVHVIGAGTMGGDIAAWCAGRGMTVTLQDQSVARIAPAIARAAKAYERKHKGDRRRVTQTLDRIVPDVSGRGVCQADVVIEAIFENIDAKHALFKSIEPMLKPGAILASNTSSLKLESIGSALRNPSRLVGIHFFNPVARMPLVEVVRGENSSEAEVQKALAFVRQLDKLPLPVKSAPGFLVNAVLGPYMLEAMRCVDAGLRAETVDEAALAFGMPMGPLELADVVGLDVALAVGKSLSASAGSAETSVVPTCLQQRADAGELGKKTGRGFFDWQNDKAVKRAPAAMSEAEKSALSERLIRPIVLTTRRLVAEGVVADADLADAGMIFGTGFAPFRGGPLHDADSRSV